MKVTSSQETELMTALTHLQSGGGGHEAEDDDDWLVLDEDGNEEALAAATGSNAGEKEDTGPTPAVRAGGMRITQRKPSHRKSAGEGDTTVSRTTLMAQLFEYQTAQVKETAQGRPLQHHPDHGARKEQYYSNNHSHSGGPRGPKQYITKQCKPVGRCR